MTPEDFISTSINRGTTEGYSVLSIKERTIFFISEAEVLCDMEGIGSLLDRIENGEIPNPSEAFHSINAIDIANCLSEIVKCLPERNDSLLDHANRLITSRHGYSFDAIKQYAEKT